MFIIISTILAIMSAVFHIMKVMYQLFHNDRVQTIMLLAVLSVFSGLATFIIVLYTIIKPIMEQQQ